LSITINQEMKHHEILIVSIFLLIQANYRQQREYLMMFRCIGIGEQRFRKAVIISIDIPPDHELM